MAITDNDKLSLIQYSIKKILNHRNQATYKIIFAHEELPFKLSGFIRDNLVIGDIEVDEKVVDADKLSSLEEGLFNRWGFRSELSVNSNDTKDFYVSKISNDLNKLVS